MRGLARAFDTLKQLDIGHVDAEVDEHPSPAAHELEGRRARGEHDGGLLGLPLVSGYDRGALRPRQRRAGRQYEVYVRFGQVERYVWDPEKALSNERKHGISFEAAREVLESLRVRYYDDPDHSDDESRMMALGPTLSADLLAVVFVDIEDDIVRIISARRMTRAERERFFLEDYL